MPRHLLKKYLPDHKKIKEHKYLSWLGDVLHNPNLWHLNRRSTARAVGIGVFWALIPVPFQMIFAAVFAILCRANLALSVCLVWLTNPLTIPPVFYFTYRIGLLFFKGRPKPPHFELSWHWLTTEIGSIWLPLYFGSLLCAILAALIGYFGMSLFWRYWVVRVWRNRKKKKLFKRKKNSERKNEVDIGRVK